jgi:hypothetical protein
MRIQCSPDTFAAPAGLRAFLLLLVADIFTKEGEN